MEVTAPSGRDINVNPTLPYSHHYIRANSTWVGIFRDTLLPSLGLHSGLSAIAYVAARSTNRTEVKDWLWPSGQFINAWWFAVGWPMYHHRVSLSTALDKLKWDGKLLLVGATVWGVRLFYRIASRSIARGSDDPRYDEAKKDPEFWNKALFSVFLPEALFQTIITLPFTAPFRYGPQHAAPQNAELFHSLAVGLFSAGFALETLADWQMERHKQKGNLGLKRDGVWSIVRHPNYLGDTLVHASFPLLLYSTGYLHPLVLLGPVANYIFLRYVGGDRENEANQEERYQSHDPQKHVQLVAWRAEKNSFWPQLRELDNPWTWVVVLAGALGVVVERELSKRF